MHTTMTEGTKQETWNVTSRWLALAVVMLLLALAVESYYLYRASHRPPPVVARTETPPLPATVQFSLDTLPPTLGMGGNPWDELNILHQRMDQLFNDTSSRFPMESLALDSAISSPSLDIREEKDHYTVRADMPGADKASIKVNVEGRLLTISGQRSSVNETKDNDKVVRSERSMAQFVRSVELPGPVNAAAVEAKYDNGVLLLTLPKAAAAAAATSVPVH